jgi:hypothetical protein
LEEDGRYPIILQEIGSFEKISSTNCSRVAS